MAIFNSELLVYRSVSPNSHLEVSTNGGTPSYHPFLDGIFHARKIFQSMDIHRYGVFHKWVIQKKNGL